MTSYPDDPFNYRKKAFPESHQYHYVNFPYAIEKVQWPVFTDLLNEYGVYRLHSRGPDIDDWTEPEPGEGYDDYGPDTGIPYDPTNGTQSWGDIIYCQKTFFSDKDVSYLDPKNQEEE